jgi:hypothetical protein
VSGTYEAEISRRNPACILFLLDQSYSMVEAFAGNSADRKANAAANAINDQLRNLILRCKKMIGEQPRDYFEVGVIGYGAKRGVGPCLTGTSAASPLIPISVLAKNPLRLESRTQRVRDGSGNFQDVVKKFPVWFDPIAEAGTPMLEAIQSAHHILGKWTAQHHNSHPPIVINITDGVPAKDPSSAARALVGTGTDDGATLLYNIHLSSSAANPISFPSGSAGLPDKFAKMLFDMSSVFPAKARKDLAAEGIQVDQAARGYIFNADSSALIRLIDIGTRLTPIDEPGWS